eukprot:g2235.t1
MDSSNTELAVVAVQQHDDLQVEEIDPQTSSSSSGNGETKTTEESEKSTTAKSQKRTSMNIAFNTTTANGFFLEENCAQSNVQIRQMQDPRSRKTNGSWWRMYTINPDRKWKLTWDSWVGVCILYNVFYAPINIAFSLSGRREMSFTGATLNSICDVTFLLDIILNFRTWQIDIVRGQEVVVRHTKAIAKTYFYGFFIIDVLSVGIPFNIASGTRFEIISVFKLLRLIRLNLLFNRKVSTTPSQKKFVVLSKLISLVIIAAHVAGCMFWLAGCDFHDGVGPLPSRGSWITAGGYANRSSLFDEYMPGFYFAMMTLTTVGYGDISPNNTFEMAWVCVFMILGAVLYALVLGMSTQVLISFWSSDEELLDKIEIMANFTRIYSFSYESRMCLADTLNYQWALAKSFDIEGMLGEMPPYLRTRTLMSMHKGLILQVPFFNDCDEAFVREVVNKLQLQVSLPGTKIMTCGEIGTAMYFVQNGQLCLTIGQDDLGRMGNINDDEDWERTIDQLSKSAKVFPIDETKIAEESKLRKKKKKKKKDTNYNGVQSSLDVKGSNVVAVLSGGAYFGEIEVLLRNVRRICTAEAITMTEYYSIGQTDLKHMLLTFPKIEEKMKRQALKKVRDLVRSILWRLYNGAQLDRWSGDKEKQDEEKKAAFLNEGAELIGGPMVPIHSNNRSRSFGNIENEIDHQKQPWGDMLHIRIRAAKELKNMDGVPLQNVDTACICSTGNSAWHASTPIAINTNAPVWNSVVAIDLRKKWKRHPNDEVFKDASSGNAVHFQGFTNDLFESDIKFCVTTKHLAKDLDETIGEFIIKWKEILENVSKVPDGCVLLSGWFKLKKNGKNMGELYLEFIWRHRSISLKEHLKLARAARRQLELALPSERIKVHTNAARLLERFFVNCKGKRFASKVLSTALGGRTSTNFGPVAGIYQQLPPIGKLTIDDLMKIDEKKISALEFDVCSRMDRIDQNLDSAMSMVEEIGVTLEY